MSPSVPRLGVLLPTRGILLEGGARIDPDVVFTMAQRAEDAGLDSVWVGDSLMAKPRLEPLTSLAAIAMQTRRVRLGTAVLLAPLRQPALLAQMATTVDVLSAGRLVLGLGVGGVFNEAQRKEWQAAGVSPSERGGRMTEIVQLCHRLWTQESVSFKGHYFSMEGASLTPRPVQPEGIPMLLACHAATGSEAQYRRAAVYGAGVMGITDKPADYARVLERVRALRTEAGLDADRLRTAFYMTVNINRDSAAAFREADDFIRRYYGLNFWADKWGPFGPPEAVARRIREYADAGAQEVIVRFASLDPQAQLATFLREVVPLARG